MVENPYPIPRQLRQSGILVGDGGDVYGPFDFEIFDTDDVVVCWRRTGEKRFVEVAGVVVTKVNGNNALNPLDKFSVKFPSNVPASTRFVVLSSRIAARDAGVMSGTRIDPDALEREFSKIATQQQELRRDLGRAVMADFGAPNFTLDADIDDGRTLMKVGDRIVAGPDIVAIGDAVEDAKNIVEGWASDIVSQGNVPIYATAVGVAALIIPEGINAFRTNGYYAAGDGGGRLYYQGDFAAGALRSADGRWWVPADKERRQYTGQIATRCVVPEFANTTNKQIMTRSRHFISEATRSLHLIYPNWYHNGNAEVGVGGTIDVTAAIEYPIGVFTRVTWGGSATVTIGDLSNSAPSDPIEVQIPDGGAEIFIRTFQSSATGIVYSGLQDTMRGETAAYGASGVVDATMGGIIPDSGPNAAYLPLAVLGQTTKPSFFIVGDSRESATSFDIPNALSVVGNIARGIAPVCGFINVARGGERLAEFVASHSKRLEVAQYCSHVAIHMGINDFTSGQTSAGALADLNTIKGYFPTHEIWFATVEPVSTSSDGWLTVANQTIDAASNANRIAFNNAIRAGITGAAGYFDIADVLESGRDSGKWRVLPGVALTSDGTHANEAGYNLVEKSGEVRSLPIFRSTAWAPRFATAAEAREGKASNLLLSPASLGTRPAFKVTKGGTDQTGILSATSTRVTWSAAVLNDGDHFLIANGNWRPPKGRYRLHGQVYVTAGLVDQAQCSIRIADNSGTAAEALWRASGTSGHTFQVEGIFETDGTNQFELWVNLAGAGDKTISGGVTRTYFEGFAI
ncbi:hypothetical protein G6L24_08380 [Agrobacterium tumefaciens]|uniref:hypothetical protein n=1 Tax=Agrobacterium tumefaciens TaxID=358 RepID=UPI002FD9A77C|nr:hypothetical protein [Agrobacterium tumefaciens]